MPFMVWHAALRTKPLFPDAFNNQTLLAPVKVTDCEETTKIDTQTKALIDSRAKGEFIDQNYA